MGKGYWGWQRVAGKVALKAAARAGRPSYCTTAASRALAHAPTRRRWSRSPPSFFAAIRNNGVPVDGATTPRASRRQDAFREPPPVNPEDHRNIVGTHHPCAFELAPTTPSSSKSGSCRLPLPPASTSNNPLFILYLPRRPPRPLARRTNGDLNGQSRRPPLSRGRRKKIVFRLGPCGFL
jgi:hypothetical protein